MQKKPSKNENFRLLINFLCLDTKKVTKKNQEKTKFLPAPEIYPFYCSFCLEQKEPKIQGKMMLLRALKYYFFFLRMFSLLLCKVFQIKLYFIPAITGSPFCRANTFF
jgi:hypothetical protein